MSYSPVDADSRLMVYVADTITAFITIRTYDSGGVSVAYVFAKMSTFGICGGTPKIMSFLKLEEVKRSFTCLANVPHHYMLQCGFLLS